MKRSQDVDLDALFDSLRTDENGNAVVDEPAGDDDFDDDDEDDDR